MSNYKWCWHYQADVESDAMEIENSRADRANTEIDHFARVHQRTQNRNVGMILTSRDDLTSEESRQRHAALKSDVRKAGYGFIEGRRFDEKSLLVVGKKGDDAGALLEHLKNLEKKYGQDSILHFVGPST
jgi:hypothetical protein